MHKRNIYRILENRRLAPKTWYMRVEGDTSFLTRPGQFVNIALEGKFLRRPISVCDYDGNTITLLYDVVGDGTLQMSRMTEGTQLDMLTGLGNGFDVEGDFKHPLLLGGGMGIAPMLRLAKDLIAAGKIPVMAMGFNTAADVVMVREFENIGVTTLVSTVDGSTGTKGFVTDALREAGIEGDRFYACGPVPLLRSLCQSMPCDGEISLDERMGCGFGICMCCSVETVDGPKRICKEGPVFKKNELIWK